MENHHYLLIVDDDRTSRDLLCRVLSSFNYSCTSASNKVDAIEQFIKNKGKFCAVITDLRMPKDGDGIELTDNLLKLKPSLVAILVTGTMPEDTSKFHLALNKPLDLGQLVRGLSLLLT